MTMRSNSRLLPTCTESRGRFLLRIFAGLVFIFLGQAKFFDSIHLVEITCGALLLSSPFLPQPYACHVTRTAALPLMVDMIVATLTVGVPNVLGRPVRIHDIDVTAQPWRLPLEVSLLITTLYLLVRPLPRLQPGPRRLLA